jgi:hypothetical protein
MTTLQPPDPGDWATTGVDLETRRVRVLWGLAALGRTAQQRQFQARYQAFMEIDEALADGYVQARYQHILISLTMPRRPQRSAAPHRQRDPQAFPHTTSMQVDPPPNRTQTDDHTGHDLEAADPLREIFRRQVAHILDQAMRDAKQRTLPAELLLERRLAALRSKGEPPPDGA